MAAAGRLPWLVFSLPVGVLLDRVSRLTVLQMANYTRIGLWALIAVLLRTGHATLPVLVVVAFTMGATEVLFDTGAEAYLPTVIHRDRLASGYGHLRASEIVAGGFAGRPVGGVAPARGCGRTGRRSALGGEESTALRLPFLSAGIAYGAYLLLFGFRLYRDAARHHRRTPAAAEEQSD